MDKKWAWKQILWIFFCFFLHGLLSHTQAMAQEAQPQIIVNLPSRTLEFYQGDTLVKEYRIAIGKASTPTPEGEYSIIEKEVDPCWYPPGKDYVVPSGPGNPLGYRWLGIAPLYGIHGTNEPWSIGSAVSNGCIRMPEEDVEELFERVDCDTSVKIEYERVKVRVDSKGKASIGIYPDVYGRQRVTLASVKQTLAAAGLGGLAEDSFLQSLIREIPDRQVEFAQVHHLKVNGTSRAEYIVSWEGKKQIPVMALADSLGTAAEWNEANQTVSRHRQTVPGIKHGNSVYIDMENLPVLFGGREAWNDRQNCLELTLPVAKFEGKLLSGDIHRIESGWIVPALTVAAALGERVNWQPDLSELMIHGKTVPFTAIGGQPYVAVKDLGELFNLATLWDDQTQTLALSYPLCPIDYSMYLDPGEEYL